MTLSKNQMGLVATCPGKIFILGEYACLDGRPALIASIYPKYKLEMQQGSSPCQVPFHKDSPAGKWLTEFLENNNSTKILNWNWIDASATAMGFGSSSAQFLLAFALLNSSILPQTKESAEKILQDYLRTQAPLQPSGLDLLNQYFGGTNLISKSKDLKITIKTVKPWSHSECRLKLLFTKTKVKTHEHLKALTDSGFLIKNQSLFDDLATLTQNAADQVWPQQSPTAFAEILNGYQDLLHTVGLVPEDFSEKIKSLRKRKGVMAAKGSGAQGGDCILMLVNSDFKAESDEIVISPDWCSEGLQVLNCS